MMLVLNSSLVNIATGIAFGYNRVIASANGKLYFLEKWKIN
jgi:hypothetical protein